MKVTTKGHTIIVKDTEGDTGAFLQKVTQEHKAFQNHNLVLDISSDTGATLKAVIEFKALSKIHRKGKKSFVVVASGIDFNAVPDSLLVVPTLLEAHDMIEMEEIERDLGF